MKKVIEKGYTLTVTSWENDGDNYRTLSKTYETEEEALVICNLLKDLLTTCEYERLGGVANQYEIDSSTPNYTFWAIYNYLKEIPMFKDRLGLIRQNHYKGSIELINDSDEFNEIENEDYVDYIIQEFKDATCDLVGHGEFELRVVENISLTYAPEDVYAKEIFKFNKGLI